jgi:TPR repeat protein
MPPPVQTAEAQNILQMLAGAGGPTQGAVPAGTPSPQAQALQGATQQLDGANPQGMVAMLRQVNDALAQAYLMAAMRIPDMATDISKARTSLERAIKTGQTAAQVVQSVRPIMNSAGVGPMAGSTGAGPDIGALLAGGGAGAPGA